MFQNLQFKISNQIIQISFLKEGKKRQKIFFEIPENNIY